MINPKSQIKITGVFDEKCFDTYRNFGIFHFGFDLRPKSFNFIQEHVLVRLVEKLPMGSITLLFENEKDFIIKRIIDETQKKFSGEVLLEFYGSEDFSFFDSFGLPYFCVLKNSIPELKGRNQIGLILNQDLLNEYSDNGNGHGLDFSGASKIYLRFSGKVNFPQSITDFFSWDLLDLEISQDICESYRKLNVEKNNSLISEMENFIKGKTLL